MVTEESRIISPKGGERARFPPVSHVASSSIQRENQTGGFSGARRVILVTVIYGLFAFAFSFVGFVALQPTVHLHEYSFPEAILEVGGHFAFGAIAAIPLKDLESSIVCGSFAVAIDADHVLAAVNLSATGRPDHSVGFAILATGFLWAVAKARPAMRAGKTAERTAAIVPVSILAHVSYDVLAAYVIFHGPGFSFPVFSPLNFTLVAFPIWSWPLLEVSAFGLGILAALAFRRQ